MTTKEIQQILKAKTSRPVNYRSYGFKDISVTGTKVSGYLAAFGNADDYGDVLIKGCFAKSITEHGPESGSFRKVAYLYQHDTTLPLGRFTMLNEDDYGLYFEAELDEIELAEQVATQYSSGTLNQHSIGFRYIWDKIAYDEATGTFIVKEVQLFEGSVVTIGANENTPFTGFKDAQLTDARQGLIDEFEEVITRVNKANPSEAYEMRKLVSKYIALYENQPPAKELVITEPAIDFDKLIKSLKTNNNGKSN